MKNHRLTSALLALIGLALAASSAGATTIAVSNGDLILGVEAASGTGSSYDYEVDLGSFQTYANATGTIDLSSLVLNSDITGTGSSGGFGSNTNDVFSVVGTTGDGTGTGQTIGSANTGTTFYTSTTLYTAQTGSATSTTRGEINSVGALLNGSTATTTNGVATFINISTNPQSYTTEENTGGEFFSLPVTGTALVNGGTLSLYENNAYAAFPNSGNAGTLTLLGTFSFANGNDFKFTAAVPEPSTDALMGLGGVLLLVVLNKRRNPAVRL